MGRLLDRHRVDPSSAAQAAGSSRQKEDVRLLAGQGHLACKRYNANPKAGDQRTSYLVMVGWITSNSCKYGTQCTKWKLIIH